MPSGYKLAAVALGAALAAAPSLAQEVYVLDSRHTSPMFEVTHIGFSQQRGSFGNTTGKVTLDRAAKKGTIDVSIATASLVTAPALLNMVKGDEFLNIEKFPAMTYKSASVQFDGDNIVGADGEFTMLGVTKPLALKLTSFKCGPNPFNKRPMCGGEATATFKRSDFGMKAALMAASDDVKLTIAFEGARE
ncbi:MAG: YceI family protein [Betaproteobacteria bacterium]